MSQKVPVTLSDKTALHTGADPPHQSPSWALSQVALLLAAFDNNLPLTFHSPQIQNISQNQLGLVLHHLLSPWPVWAKFFQISIPPQNKFVKFTVANKTKKSKYLHMSQCIALRFSHHSCCLSLHKTIINIGTKSKILYMVKINQVIHYPSFSKIQNNHSL